MFNLAKFFCGSLFYVVLCLLGAILWAPSFMDDFYSWLRELGDDFLSWLTE